MDYNKTNNNSNLNYYPTFDSPLSNTHSHFTPSYNDNSLNPPSTSTDVTRHHLSRDPSIDNIQNDTINNINSNQIPHINIATHNIQDAFFSKLHNILIQMISLEIDIMFLTEIHLKKSSESEKYETQTNQFFIILLILHTHLLLSSITTIYTVLVVQRLFYHKILPNIYKKSKLLKDD
jgi:hypothetical protein